MKQKRLVATGVFILLLVLNMAIGAAFDGVSSDLNVIKKDNFTEDVYTKGSTDKVAILEVDGAIMGGGSTPFNTSSYDHDVFLEQLDHAFKDRSVKGIVLYVNSPGGGVLESDEIHGKIKSLKEEYKKPIVTYMHGVAASGGYYIAAPTDEIIANRNVITGSLGVIMGLLNYHELAENYGVKVENITSGEYKDIGNPFKEMTAEERAIIQAMIDESYDFFVDVIADGRNLDKQRVREIADGRIYTASQAKELNLIDDIGNLEHAIDRASELAQVNRPTVIKYKKSDSFDFLGLLNLMENNQKSILGIDKFINSSRPRPMYLWME